MKRLLYFLRYGHWPKKFRYPSGIPRVVVPKEVLEDVIPLTSLIAAETRKAFEKSEREQWEIIFNGREHG